MNRFKQQAIELKTTRATAPQQSFPSTRGEERQRRGEREVMGKITTQHEVQDVPAGETTVVPPDW
jgi:hypothetical protein